MQDTNKNPLTATSQSNNFQQCDGKAEEELSAEFSASLRNLLDQGLIRIVLDDEAGEPFLVLTTAGMELMGVKPGGVA